MKSTQIKSVEKLQILEKSQSISYGAQQRFYSSQWKQAAGCGPTAASNLVLYEFRKDLCEETAIHEESIRQIMNVMWKHITPGIMGVHVYHKFVKGIQRYLKEQNLSFSVKHLYIDKNKGIRVSIEDTQKWLEEALSQNHLVAFLNRHNGLENALDRWHWVVLYKVDYDENDCKVMILDQGKKIEIDLKLWLNSTKDCGAFVVLTD